MKILIFIFALITINLSAQTKLTKKLFFPTKKELPVDYKTIVGDPNGWRVVGYFNLNNDKVETKLYPWDTLRKLTPFREGKMYLKYRGNKIVSKGDRKGTTKIIYVTKDTLILEGKIIRNTKDPEKKVVARQLYIRVK